MTRYLIGLSLLAAAVILLRGLFGKKLSARLVYALWLAVLIKICLPFSVFELELDLPEGLSFLASEQQTAQPPISSYTPPQADTPDISQPDDTPVTENPGTSQNPGEDNETSVTPVPPITENPDGGEQPQNPAVPDSGALPQTPGQTVTVNNGNNTKAENGINIQSVLGIVWLCGTCLLGLWFGISGIVYFSKLRQNRVFLEKRGKTRIYLAEKADTPCLSGRKIYLTPAADQSEHRELVIEHELTHLCHGDHIWSIVRIAVLCVFWWNPLIWASAILSRQDSELACDEAVAERITEAEKIPYARLIVDMIPKKKLYAVGLGGGSLKKRIIALTEKHKKHIITAICVVLAVLVIGGCTLIAVNGRKEKQEPASQAVITFFSSAKSVSFDGNGYAVFTDKNAEIPFDEFEDLAQITELFGSIDTESGDADLSPYTPYFVTTETPYKIAVSEGEAFEFQCVDGKIAVKTASGSCKWLTSAAAASLFELFEKYGLTEENYFADYSEYPWALPLTEMKSIISPMESWFRVNAFSTFVGGEFSFSSSLELSDEALIRAFMALNTEPLQEDRLSQEQADKVLSKYFKDYDLDITRLGLSLDSNGSCSLPFNAGTVEQIENFYRFEITFSDIMAKDNRLTFTASFAPDECLKKTYTLELYDGGYYFISVTDNLNLKQLSEAQKVSYEEVLLGITPFIMDGKEYYLDKYIQSMGYQVADGTMFSMVDIDGDRLSEIIIALPNWSARGSLIMNYHNGTVYAEHRNYRTWSGTLVTGIASSAGGASESSYLSASFENGKMTTEKLFYTTYDVKNGEQLYYIGTEKVTEQQWEEYRLAQEAAPGIAFYRLNGDSINKALNPVMPVAAESVGQFTLYGRAFDRWLETEAQRKPDFDVETAGKEAVIEGEEYYFYKEIAFENEYMIFSSQRKSEDKVIIPKVDKNGFTENIVIEIPKKYAYDEINPVLSVSGGGSGEYGVILQLKKGENVYYLRYDNFSNGWNNGQWDKLELVGEYTLPDNWIEIYYGMI